jgi:hypothetical protein
MIMAFADVIKAIFVFVSISIEDNRKDKKLSSQEESKLNSS